MVSDKDFLEETKKEEELTRLSFEQSKRNTKERKENYDPSGLPKDFTEKYHQE